MNETIAKIVEESLELKKSFFAGNGELIAGLAGEVASAISQGKKVLLFGNGGSAADAQHIAAEFVGRFRRERRPLPALALTTDTSVLTSVANDYGYEHVFERQILALGNPGDIAIGISTSGNAPSVLRAIEVARGMGILTVALTGGDGGKLGPLVDYHLNVPSRFTDRVQEVHIMVGHVLCHLVEEADERQ
ncbi:MAG: D-sedoheptulose 7-phosphate isomerase [Acidobacteria bacterium]|nr:D-sedoheptulose 7-phosphate isomerase [Acidobacteriota bacterium]